MDAELSRARNRSLSLHDDYTHRPNAIPFDDTPFKDEWQDKVYEAAWKLALNNNYHSILDFGCGSGFKLLKYFRAFQTVGFEIQPTLNHLTTVYPDREWRDGSGIEELDLSGDILICSDVIEHLRDPIALLKRIAVSSLKRIVISTPALELFADRGSSPRLGPPANKSHVNEWTTNEFRTFVTKYLHIEDHIVVNISQATQLIVASRDDRLVVNNYRRSTLDHRNRVIRELVGGRTFVDVGGLWGLTNEKVTVAHAAGAKNVCMVDIWKPESEWWAKFRDLQAQMGISQAREVIGSIDNPATVSEVGEYDIVHCSGVLYHCPNPFYTLMNLRAITRQTLVLGTAVVPNRIENTYGSLEIADDAAICVPCLQPHKRGIVSKYVQDRFGGGAWGITDPVDSWFFENMVPNYGPWWWLWTSTYVDRMLSACGFQIIDDYDQFDGTGHLFVSSPSRVTTANFGVF